MAVTPNSIVTPQTPKAASVGLTTGNTTFTTSPTNTQLLITAGINGARVTKLQDIQLEQINTANNIQAYRDNATACVSKFLCNSVLMATIPPGAVVANTLPDFGYSVDNPLILVANER